MWDKQFLYFQLPLLWFEKMHLFLFCFADSSFPTPMEEPRKVLRCHYLGSHEVIRPTGKCLHKVISHYVMMYPDFKEVGSHLLSKHIQQTVWLVERNTNKSSKQYGISTNKFGFKKYILTLWIISTQDFRLQKNHLLTVILTNVTPGWLVKVAMFYCGFLWARRLWSMH